MATGHTMKLMHEGQTFNDFVLGCARAMGACISLRGMPSDTEIPEAFTPAASHTERLAKADSELEILRSVPLKGREARAIILLNTEIAWLEKLRTSSVEENSRLINMALLVTAWQPPTKNHRGLKEFMLEQIRISRHITPSLCSAQIEKLHQLGKTPLNYFDQSLLEAQKEVQMAQQSLDEEVSRCQSRTGWVKSLRDSLL